jgi:hypothetical protein
MRTQRKTEESFFVHRFMEYCRAEIDNDASEILEITDSPDLAISSLGRVIGVEFSQFPSSYIIESFHKKRPEPTYTKNEIEGNLTIYPFEPHRWVHEVLDKKCGRVGTHKKRINADEMWLVMHCHSTTSEWPMSDMSEKANREFEALLMRFGTKQYRSSFERIFYIYADGTVVTLSGDSIIVPSAVMLVNGLGYPAVTTHQFSFSFDVPLPGLGVRNYQFQTLQFSETIIAPIDDSMANRSPEIERPKFTAEAQVDSDKVDLILYRNGVLAGRLALPISNQIGKTMYMHSLVQWGIEETDYMFNT